MRADAEELMGAGQEDATKNLVERRIKFQIMSSSRKQIHYLFVMKSKIVMTRVKRERLQPLREIYVKISGSLGDGESATCFTVFPF